MTRAYRWQVEHTPRDEASRSSSPRMVIITTLTGCWSTVATHSAQSVSYESPTNPRIVLRSSRKIQPRDSDDAWTVPPHPRVRRVDFQAVAA